MTPNERGPALADLESHQDRAETTGNQGHNTETPPVLQAGFCSGYGQWHSRNNPVAPRPYVSITMAQIVDMAADPRSIDKDLAQWAIFSRLPSRVHSEQRDQGQFHALWADIDEPGGLTFDNILDRVERILPASIAFTTRSATPDRQKCRIIAGLAGPVSGAEFILLQKILNDKLQAAGITPDRATERAGQVCYLPNRGEFYAYQIDQGAPLDPSAWAADVAAEQHRQRAEEQAKKERREAAKIKAAERMASGNESPIDAFNAAYDLPLMLDACGYVERGRKWLSPNSESGVPGVTITNDGRKWLSAHGSDAGVGTATNNGTLGDAFDLFTYYQHHGDRDRAIKAAADMFGCKSIVSNRHNNPPTESPEPFNLASFSLRGQSKAMEAKMLSDRFVMGRIAILGQATVFYSGPNMGKTLLSLWLIRDAIKRGEIKGEDVFYINADDTYKGLVYKNKFAEDNGFHMLAPGHNGFKSEHLADYLKKIIESSTAAGKVLILDTVKKFTDLMRKDKASLFGEQVRQFVSHGGTVIMLAHVNKHRGEDNKVIYSGTTDLVDDADCAYTIDTVTTDGTTRTIKFENFKARGDVAREAVYRYDYSDGTTYHERLASVVEVAEQDRKQAEKRSLQQKTLEKNRMAVDAIIEVLREGVHQKTALIKEASSRYGISKKQIAKALADHLGKSLPDNQFWHLKVEGKNAHTYHLNYGVF